MGEPIRRLGDAPLDDATLVRLVQARDVGAFRALYERYRLPLIRYAYSYVRSYAVAEDVVQTLFTTLWCIAPQWEVRTSVESYLFLSARHLAGKYRERSRWEMGVAEAGRDARIGVIPVDPEAERPVGSDRTVKEACTTNVGEASVLVEELAQLFAKAVAELPEAVRAAYRMARDRRMNYVEIGEALGVTPNQVRRLIMAAHEELDRRLTRAGWSGMVLHGGLLGARTERTRSRRRDAGGGYG